MSLYRGAGGASDATDDSTVNAVAGYASAAASSASAAATSATGASNSATAAASSASSAATSASSVATNATNAANSAALAGDYAALANISKEDAAASAATASTKAGEASTSASNASTSASTATTQATNAANSASAAAGSATSAATSASNAFTYATNANDSRILAEAAVTGASSFASAAQASSNSAQSYATAALSARDATLAAYDNFDDRYLGTKSSDPVVDNDGNPLIAGALYFSSTAGSMKVYTGSAWVDAYVSGTGLLAINNNLSDLQSATTARTNLGLGTVALENSTALVHTTGDETIAGTKTFTNTITGSITGNAATVTNGVYTSGDQTIGGTKTFTSTITGSISGNAGTVTNGVYTTGSYADPSWITSLAGSKITGNISGNAATATSATTATNVSGGTADVTTLTTSSTVTLNGGTANGVTYLNGSKVLTSGSALTFDGTNLGLGTASPSGASGTTFAINGGAGQTRLALKNNNSGDASSDGFQIALLSDGVNVVYQNRESGYQAWEGNGSELMRLTSTGLGIGTSSPGERLTVQTALTGTTAGSNVVGRFQSNGNGYDANISLGDNNNAAARLGYLSGNMYFWTNGAERMRLDASGNLGLEVTPSAWGSSYKALQLAAGSFSGNSGAIGFEQNAYHNGTNWIYRSNGAASHYETYGGAHYFFTAPSGTAGNAISFTQAMTLDASGNLGIGTSSPAGPLEVVTQNTNESGIYLTADGSSFGYASNLYFRSKLTTGGSIGVAAKIRAELSSSNNAGLLFFTTASGTNAERMRLDSSGNLGLGVTPSAWGLLKALDVSSSGALFGYTAQAGISNNAYFDGSNWKYKNTAAAAFFRANAGAFEWHTAPSGTAGNAISFTQAMTLDASGNLGVGTASPGEKVTATSANANNYTTGLSSQAVPLGTNVRLENTSATTNTFTGTVFVPTNSGGQGQISYLGAVSTGSGLASELVFGRRSTATGYYVESARIDSSGNLLVGTTSNSRSANGAITFTDVNSGRFTAIGNNSGTNGALFEGVRTDTQASTILIRPNGNVQNANNSYGAISDAKLKENVVDATPKLEKLQQVRVVNYNLIGDDKKQLGVIAQELEQVFPGMVDESVDRDEEGNDLGTTTKSVKYSVFVPMLIKAIQEQQAIINTQQTALEQLKARLDAANL